MEATVFNSGSFVKELEFDRVVKRDFEIDLYLKNKKIETYNIWHSFIFGKTILEYNAYLKQWWTRKIPNLENLN